MNLKQLKIGQRLTLGFASVLALLLVLTALAWNGLQASQAATERVVALERRSAATDEWAATTTLNINRVLAVALSRADAEVDGHFKPLIDKASARISELQKALESDIESEAGKALLAKISSMRTEYIATRKTYFDTLKSGDVAAANQQLTNGLMPAAERYSAAQAELQAFQRSLVEEAVAQSAATSRNNVMLLVSLAAAAVLVASLVECFLILPNHMAHALKHKDETPWYDAPSRFMNRQLDRFRLNVMRPFTMWVIRLRYPVLAGVVLLLASQVALLLSGRGKVVTVQGRQVGIVGATTESLPLISSPRNVVVNPVAAAVQAPAIAPSGISSMKVMSSSRSMAKRPPAESSSA